MSEQPQSPARPSPASPSPMPALLTQLHALLDELATADASLCSDAELVDVARSTEQALTRLTYQGNRQIIEASDRGLPRAMGYRNITNFMNVALRISDPVRRRDQMNATGRFHHLDGTPAEPTYPTLAGSFADGTIGPAHLRKVIEVLDKIPHQVAHDKKVAAQATLAELARDHTPAELTTLGSRLLAHLDPDGDVTDDCDRQRRRNLWLNRQNTDQMSKLTGNLDPETRALLDVLLAAWAKPGLNNPEDPQSPTGTDKDTAPDALKAAADRDTRTQAQRNHDALKALLRAVLDDGLLGKTHRGLPIQLIVKADLTDLVGETGFGTTASGTTLPITDVIALAADAQPWLSVFADSTAIPLFFGQGKRFATTPQRLASFSRPDGHVCSAPGCDQPATQVEMHHARLDFAQGGNTDITDLTPACPVHNRMVNDRIGGFTTGIHDHGPDAGRTWWQLNNAPGSPPNPRRVQRLPDTGELFDNHLEHTRADIHGPPPRAPHPGPEPTTPGLRDRLPYTETIAPPISVIEARLALALCLRR